MQWYIKNTNPIYLSGWKKNRLSSLSRPENLLYPPDEELFLKNFEIRLVKFFRQFDDYILFDDDIFPILHIVCSFSPVIQGTFDGVCGGRELHMSFEIYLEAIFYANNSRSSKSSTSVKGKKKKNQ